MTKYPDFKELEQAVKKMGFNRMSLNIILDPYKKGQYGIEDIILGESGGGIYLDTRKGTVHRIVLHICDITTFSIYRGKNKKLKEVVEKGEFDSPKLIRQLHKYHFTNCKTLDKMIKTGKEDRYNASLSWNGKFLYNIMEENKVKYKNKNQRLYPCRNCLYNFSKETGQQYEREEFNIKDVLKTSSRIPPHYKLECQYIPNIYSKDWPAISQKRKEKKNYKCEECNKDFSKDKKNLHCHHINSVKSDNRTFNLKVLCISCHKKEHPHMP